MTKFVIMKHYYILLLIVITACKYETIPDRTLRQEEPVSQTYHFYYLYTEKGKPVLEIKAPYVLETWENKEKAQTQIEFPNSFNAYFYDSLQRKETYLYADYAKIYNNKTKAIARGNVILKNLIENKKLETEELLWDKQSNKIYSNKIVKITTPEEILIGKGFESTTDFKHYKFKQISGTFKVEVKE